MRSAHVSATWSNQLEGQNAYAGRDEELHAKHNQPKARDATKLQSYFAAMNSIRVGLVDSMASHTTRSLPSR